MNRESKKDKMDKESELLADYMISTQCTIMELEKQFGIPKSTVHRRLTNTLPFVDLDKWSDCQYILKAHSAEALVRARGVLKNRRAHS